MTEPNLEPTSFLNVDLDVWSQTDLTPLVAAFGERVFVLFVGREGRRHGLHIELAGSGIRGSADSLIQALVALIRALPRSARQHWRNASRRSFNVGVQASTQPQSYELQLTPETLRAVAHVGADVTLTVYAAPARETAPANPPPSRKRRPNPGVQRTRFARR
jgi:hypothetical protein